MPTTQSREQRAESRELFDPIPGQRGSAWLQPLSTLYSLLSALSPVAETNHA